MENRAFRRSGGNGSLGAAQNTRSRRGKQMLAVHVIFFLSGMWLVVWRMHNPQIPRLPVGVTRNLAIILVQMILSKMLFDMFNDRYNINTQFKAEQKRHDDKIEVLERQIEALRRAQRGGAPHDLPAAPLSVVPPRVEGKENT